MISLHCIRCVLYIFELKIYILKIAPGSELVVVRFFFYFLFFLFWKSYPLRFKLSDLATEFGLLARQCKKFKFFPLFLFNFLFFFVLCLKFHVFHFVCVT